MKAAGLTQEGADSEFYIRQMQQAKASSNNANGGCGNGDTSQRDELLAKIGANKDA